MFDKISDIKKSSKMYCKKQKNSDVFEIFLVPDQQDCWIIIGKKIKKKRVENQLCSTGADN